MPITRLPIPNDNAGNYYDGVESQFWIYPILLTDVAPFVIRGAFSVAAAAVSAVSLTTAAATTIVLPKGHRVLSDNGLKCVEVATQSAAGVLAVPILPMAGAAIAAATTFSAVTMIPVYSVAEVGAKPSTDNTSVRNYGSPTNEVVRTHKTKIELAPKGFATKGDVGLTLLKRAAHGEGFVYVRYVMPDEQAIEGYFNVVGADEGSTVDKDYENSFTLAPASAVSYLNLILR